jgi:phospholipid transport system substrate-binding protein
MKVLLLLTICLAAARCAAGADDPNDPVEMLRKKWDSIVPVLDNEDLTREEKKEKINGIVNPIFDFGLMSKLALGRKNWLRLKPSQREEFTRLFMERLKESYGEKISLYTGQKAVFKPAEKKKNVVRIPMELVSETEKVDLLYKLRSAEGCWRIYDVEIQGVSVLLTYRSQFNDILGSGTIEDLLSRLEEPPSG